MKFTDEVVQEVWKKGKLLDDFDENVYRRDDYGAWIMSDEYGNRSSKFGWEIERIDPNGGDEINNLKPVQWSNKK